MKLHVAISFALCCAAGLIGVELIGANLGGAFWIVTVACIASPIAASARHETAGAFATSTAASLGAALAAIALRAGDAFSLNQVLAIAAVTLSLGLAAAGIVRALVAARVAATLAGAVVVALLLAWLSWPFWLSTWFTSAGGDELAARLTAVHPLLAINAIAPQFGYWTQSHYLYRLTSLGQDVMLTLPDTVRPCVSFQSAIACLAWSPWLVAAALARWRRPATQAA